MSSPLLNVDVRLEPDVVLARQRARQIAGMLGFAPLDQTRIATAVSEIARSAFQYAGGARVDFRVGTGPPPGLLIRVHERASGVKDLQAMLEGRYDSPPGLGVGLLGARRLMDKFEIDSSEGAAVVTMIKTLPRRTSALTPQELARVSSELAKHTPQGLLEELQMQNQELIRTLQELRDRQAELAQLHAVELEETNRGVVALYSELDDHAKELRRISDLKSRFLSNMSHEFRSPLNTILSMTGFLLDGSSGELTPEQHKELSFIRTAAEGLSGLVNDLLDLAKVEAGKAVVRPETFEVADLFETLRGTTEPLLSGAEVTLVVEEPVGVATMQTDEAKLAQILRNFLSNAAKFTERGEIRLAAQAGPGDMVIFRVSDTGIGIAPADQRRVFEEFNQVEGRLQRRVKGTGLGLPLSRKLADLLGGEVSVRSKTGVGSTFVAVIPRSYGASEPESASRPASGRNLDPLQSTVLVVEEDPVDLLLYEKLLQGGLPGPAGKDTPRGRRMLSRLRPMAVLLDIVLDAENGWSLLTEMKGQAATKDIPILVLTVVDGKERALALGAADFCLKPIDQDWLLGRLHALEQEGTFSTVLIIDDEEADRYLLKGLLTAHGRFAILEAATGAEGLRRAREERPDVIFLDMVMPDMTGFEVLERLKADDGTKELPVILNTSAVLGEDEWRRLTAGTVAVVSKSPGGPEESFSTIREALIQAGLRLTPPGQES